MATTKVWITSTRYIRQAGQTEPQIVEASPNHPVLVEIEGPVKYDAQTRPEQPEKLKPHFAPNTKAPTPNAADRK
jgi:hypothetical protein